MRQPGKHKPSLSPADYLVLSFLQTSTTYDWRVKSWCDTVANTASGFSETKSFTTASDADNTVLLLYPNPAQDEVIIQAPGMETVQVFNVHGQLVKQVNRTADDASVMVLSIADLPSGLYLMVVGNHDYRTAAMLSVVK
jgi:lactam utilization protein B